MIPPKKKQMRKLKFGDATYLTNAQPGFNPCWESLSYTTKNKDKTGSVEQLTEVTFLIPKIIYCEFKNLK